MIQKLFPNIQTNPLGVSTRRSRILHHFAPLKLLGKREYIDPNFLEELSLSRTDHVHTRRIASFIPSAPSALVLDEHTLQNIIGALPSFRNPSYLLQLETNPPQQFHFPASTILWGIGTLQFAAEAPISLSLDTPLHLPEGTIVHCLGGTFLTLLTTKDPVPSDLSPSPLPTSLLDPVFPENTGYHHLTQIPLALPQGTIIHFQLQGITEVYEHNQLIDIIYTGEERILQTDTSSYHLTAASDEPTSCIHIFDKES